VQLGNFTLTLGNVAGGEFAGVISGTGALVKVGSGELILSGSNTFTGGVTVTAGTLRVGNATIIGSVEADILNSGVLVFDRSNNFTYGGVISGTGALVQQGSATLTLSGTNLYTGLTSVNSGTLASLPTIQERCCG
jgi:autotransporter-associated beta strand protein